MHSYPLPRPVRAVSRFGSSLIARRNLGHKNRFVSGGVSPGQPPAIQSHVRSISEV